jgi:hypothetical protein
MPDSVVQVSHDKFFWTAPVAAMAVTSTAKGIAPKFVLLGTAAGQARTQSCTQLSHMNSTALLAAGCPCLCR